MAWPKQQATRSIVIICWDVVWGECKVHFISLIARLEKIAVTPMRWLRRVEEKYRCTSTIKTLQFAVGVMQSAIDDEMIEHFREI